MVDWLAYWSARSKCTGENKSGTYRIFTSWRWRYAGYRSAFWAWRRNDHDWHFRPGLGKTTIWKFNCILNQFPVVFIMQNLILIGGGGYCKSCIDVIQGAELSIAPQLPNASAFVSLFQIVRLSKMPQFLPPAALKTRSTLRNQCNTSKKSDYSS